MDTLALVLVIILSVLLLVALYFLARQRTAPDAAALHEVVEQLTQARLELRSLAERVRHVEEGQSRVHSGIADLDRTLAQADAMSKSLAQVTGTIRQELAQAQNQLAALQAQAKARQEMESQVATSIRRLETIIAGTQSKGAAGENILEVVFAKLPAEWQVRNFRIGNKVVEFALRLPNNLVLPIDSKWPATDLLEQLADCSDPDERSRLKQEIEKVVLAKAGEVRKYIDPSATVAYGIAAVPDAIYDLCYGIQVDLLQMNVVLVSYSMFVPYLLLVFQTVLKTARDIDVQRLLNYVASAQESARLMQEELESRFARALTMLSNSRNEMAMHLSRISSGLASLQLTASATEED